MQHDSEAVRREPTIGQRIGFWLGLLLFVTLLLSPTPASMREAVRRGFAEEIQADVLRQLDVSGQTDAASENSNHLGATGGLSARAGTGSKLPVAPPLDETIPVSGPVSEEFQQSAAYKQAESNIVEPRARAMLAAAAVTALVACWWISVAIPIPVTSLLPLVLFPIVGVMPIKAAAIPYANSNVFLFMGGFIIALALERWGLHRRIALHIVRLIGSSRPNIVLGFMLASAMLSMWISNTAATLMMLPIAMAIISAIAELDENADKRTHANFSAALMLGVAYAASVGGIATPIGTPPNISFRGQFARLFPAVPEISFGQWMLVFLPLVAVFLPLIWLVLVRITCPVPRGRLNVGRDIIRNDLRKLGQIRRPEAAVLTVFATTALLWMTRSIPIGAINYGWSGILERLLTRPGHVPSLFHAGYINDATVALGMAILLFIIPAGRDESGTRRHLMNWETAQRLPWGILLLFGGGFSIAAGFQASGLSLWCGQSFAGLGITNPLVLVLGTCLMMTFLTEITSNTATTEVMLPILAGVSIAMDINPLMLMLPATISASCAFMLPVATPPNAIVFGSGCVEMKKMVRSGLIINLIGVILITATYHFIAKPLLGID